MSFEEVLAAARRCDRCLKCPAAGQPVLPHDPNPLLRGSDTASIAIVGQAPGLRAHLSGKSFNDPSGVRLRAWLGMSEEEFYDISRVALVPIGFCFPGYDQAGHDLQPRKECAPLWQDRVFRALPELKLLLIVGSYAQKWHLGSAVKGKKMDEIVRSWREYSSASEGPDRFVLPHPSWRNSGWLNRNPWFAEEILPVIKEKVRSCLDGAAL